MRRHIIFSAMLLLLVVNTARADLVVDTVIAPAECAFASVCTNFFLSASIELATLFPVVHGGILSFAETVIDQAPPAVPDSRSLFVEIHRVKSRSVPDERGLFSVDLTEPALGIVEVLPGTIRVVMTRFDFTPFNISVSPGDLMAITYRTDDPLTIGGWILNGGFPGASLLGRRPPLSPSPTVSTWFGGGGAIFLTTFVETSPAAIPEPASLLLLGTGVAGLVALRWWNSKRFLCANIAEAQSKRRLSVQVVCLTPWGASVASFQRLLRNIKPLGSAEPSRQNWTRPKIRKGLLAPESSA